MSRCPTCRMTSRSSTRHPESSGLVAIESILARYCYACFSINHLKYSLALGPCLRQQPTAYISKHLSSQYLKINLEDDAVEHSQVSRVAFLINMPSSMSQRRLWVSYAAAACLGALFWHKIYNLITRIELWLFTFIHFYSGFVFSPSSAP
jgi:hypothetical protein